MTKKKYRRYSPEFKRQVLKRASEDGVTEGRYIRPRAQTGSASYRQVLALLCGHDLCHVTRC